MAFCGQCGAQRDSGFATSEQYDQNANPYASPNSYSNPFSAAQGSLPSTYLIWNILATFLCCMPLGVAGIVFSSMAQGAKDRGDLTSYLRSARRAKICFWASALSGFFVVVLFLLWGVAASSGAAFQFESKRPESSIPAGVKRVDLTPESDDSETEEIERPVFSDAETV